MTIEVLYPEICCLFGDKANARYLAEALPEAEFVYTPLAEEPVFVKNDVAMIYLASMSESSQTLVTEALLPHRERLAALMESGCVILATGNAFEIFGEKIVTETGLVQPGLDLVPVWTKRHIPKRDNSLVLGAFGDMTIVGYTSRFADSFYKDGAEPLFQVEKGYGMNKQTQQEGIRKGGFFGTHLLGPLLIQNPDFCLYIQKLLGVEQPGLPWEEDVRRAFDIRLEELKREIQFFD